MSGAGAVLEQVFAYLRNFAAPPIDALTWAEGP